MTRHLVLIIISIGLCGCWVIKKQNTLLSGLHKATQEKYVQLLSDKEFRQQRGKWNETYYALAGKGSYRLIFESDSGEYYFADGPKFVCETHRVGGVFLNKKDSTLIYGQAVS